MTKILTTPILLEADKQSRKKFGAIRGLNLPKGAELDPEGFHVIRTTIGQELNVRCEVLCKLVGKTAHEPVTAWIDMEYETYNRLMTFEEFKQFMSETT